MEENARMIEIRRAREKIEKVSLIDPTVSPGLFIRFTPQPPKSRP